MNPAQVRNADNLVDDPHGLAIYEEKPNTDHLETASIEEQKAVNSNADYSGFTQKTDPKEIKLVRKLDMYIMVSSCHSILKPMLTLDLLVGYVLAQLPRPKRHRLGQT